MPTVLLMALLHSFGQDDMNEVQHDFFGQVAPLVLALALHGVNIIVNSSIACLGSR